jgi:hypothetical protein
MGPGLNVTFKSFCVIRISVNIRWMFRRVCKIAKSDY